MSAIALNEGEMVRVGDRQLAVLLVAPLSNMCVMGISSVIPQPHANIPRVASDNAGLSRAVLLETGGQEAGQVERINPLCRWKRIVVPLASWVASHLD